LALWRGSFPTIVRAGMMNMGMIAPYEEIKERINAWTHTQDALGTRIFSSVIAGIVASTLALPPDNLKTKLQRMKKGADGKYPYTGLVDCFTKSIK
jgi:solute carrier family 25 oxoglutarate transporter 11